MTQSVVVYSKAHCPYCDRAKQLLAAKQVAYEEIRIDLDPDQAQTMMARSGRKTVPQLFIGNHHVGGFDDLWALEQAGKLDPLLNSSD